MIMFAIVLTHVISLLWLVDISGARMMPVP